MGSCCTRNSGNRLALAAIPRVRRIEQDISGLLRAVTRDRDPANSVLRPHGRIFPMSHRTADMISRRTLLAYAVAASTSIAVPALAAETVTYTPAAFDEAQKSGKSILVEIHATWCPTCKAQAPILSELEKGAKFQNLLVLHVDFDSQKDAVRRFGAHMQSTLITFRDGKETGRSVGDTDRT